MNRHFVGTIAVMTALALESVKSRVLYGFIYSGNNPTRRGISSWQSLELRSTYWTHFIIRQLPHNHVLYRACDDKATIYTGISEKTHCNNAGTVYLLSPRAARECVAMSRGCFISTLRTPSSQLCRKR